MYVVTNGKTFRVKREDGSFVSVTKNAWLYTAWIPKEFDTQEEAKQYIKDNTWVRLTNDTVSEAP